MNIGPVSNSNSLATLLQLNSTAGASPASVNNVNRRGYPNISFATRRVLMSKLQQLQQQDPAQFKQVAGQLATSLQQAAQQSGNEVRLQRSLLSDPIAVTSEIQTQARLVADLGLTRLP